MKAINAIVAPATEFSHMLQDRRFFPNLKASAIKRDNRRKQRRALRADLPSAIAIGMAEGVLEVRSHTPMPAHPKSAIAQLPPEFLLPTEEFEPKSFMTVKVVRKRAFHRTVVEHLQVAAH